MQPAARIQTSIEILEKIAASRVPMDGTIGDYMRFRRYIGSKDRAAIVERVYNIMRHHARLGWHLAQAGAEDTPRARMLAWLILGENAKAESIAAMFDGGQYTPAPLTDDETALLEKLAGQEMTPPAMPEAVQVECPPEHEAALRGYFGADFGVEMQALLQGAPLDLRVNTRLIPRDKAQDALAKDKVRTQPTAFSPWGLRAESKAFLSQTKPFVKGWIEIQDEGSQLIAYMCAAKPGMQVLDYCAGAGGKTMALAAAMENKGRIVATDTEKNRLERARARFRRAHVHDIIEVRALSDDKNRKWLRRQKETFDAVLADVPCSGTGTWRRNPDLRWRQHGPALADLLTVQAEILDKTAKTVKPGGRLIYATCSLLPAENENQIEAFLARNPDFALLPLTEAWPENSQAPGDGSYMRLTPRRHNTDGFFAAALQRTSSGLEPAMADAEDDTE